MKKTVGWINITIRRSGGFRYEDWVRQGLAPFFDVELKDISWSSLNKRLRQLKPFLWLVGLVALWFAKPKDVWVRGDIVSCILPLWTRRKNILMIHHIDPTVWPFWQRTLYRFLEGFIYRNAKKADAVVTISNYWQKHFVDRGFKRVYKIYNCFPVEEYNVSEQEVLDFKKKFQLEGKPIVYIGNCQREKGVVIAYEALKDLPVYLVTSGQKLPLSFESFFSWGVFDPVPHWMVYQRVRSNAVQNSGHWNEYCRYARAFGEFGTSDMRQSFGVKGKG